MALGMSLRGMYWMAVGMAALAFAMVVAMPGFLPATMFTMSGLMAAAAWLKMPPAGPPCLCGTRPPEGSDFCNHCGARLTPRPRARARAGR